MYLDRESSDNVQVLTHIHPDLRIIEAQTSQLSICMGIALPRKLGLCHASLVKDKCHMILCYQNFRTSGLRDEIRTLKASTKIKEKIFEAAVFLIFLFLNHHRGVWPKSNTR